MKNYYSEPLKFFLISSLFFVFYSCSESKTEDASLPQASDIEILKSLGHDVTGMVEKEAYYMLIPDIIVSKERIKELRKPPETRMQWEVKYGKLDENYQTIYLKDTGIGEFRDILIQAINEWNNLGTNIFFVFNNKGAVTVDITSGFDGDSFSPIIIENPLRNGEYGRHVRLNSSKLLPLFKDPEQGKYLMMHVLGHIVGFGHAVTDPFANTPNGFIIGTTNSDTQSIMRTESDILNKKEKWTGFSKWDKLAIEFVYPNQKKNILFTLDCTPQPTGNDGTTLSLEITYLFTAKYTNPRCPNPAYDIVIEKTDEGISGYNVTKTGNGRFSVTFTRPGNYRVSFLVTNTSPQTQLVKIYTIPDVAPPTYYLECTPKGGGILKNTLLVEWRYKFTPKYSYDLSLSPRFELIDIMGETPAIFEGRDFIIHEGTPIQELAKGIFEVTFYTPGEYRIIHEVLNVKDPTVFEVTYIVIPEPPKYYLECTPAGTGTDGKTLMLEKKYTFTPKYSFAIANRPSFVLIDIFGESPEICEGEDFEILFDLPIQEVASGNFQVIFHTPGKYRIVNQAQQSSNVATEFEEIYNVQ